MSYNVGIGENYLDYIMVRI